MDLLTYRSHDERRACRDIARIRPESAGLVADLQQAGAEVTCSLCGRVTEHRLVGDNTRESLPCPGCTLNPRQRAGFLLLDHFAPSAIDVFLTEQASPVFATAQRRYRARGGEHVQDVDRREALSAYLATIGGSGEVDYLDATVIAHAAGSFDAVLSLDVLEHIPEFGEALGEFARVLRPGGHLIASFPFTDQPTTLTRAEVIDGHVRHIESPEYHGDPVNGDVLCFYHFGWDVLDAARAAGFADARMAIPYSPAHGYFFGACWTLVARR